jgi:ankyrin repeat protein
MQKECIFKSMKKWNLILALACSTLFFVANVFGQDEDEYVDSPLMVAVKTNNYKEVVRLVSAGANVNEKGEHSWSPDPLAIAVEQHLKPIATFLLEHGATSRTGLYAAIETGDVEWVKFLLSYNFTDYEGMMAAVESKNVEMVKLLISHGFKVNFAQKRRLGLFRKEYVTPMEEALDDGSEKIIYELVKGGVPVTEAYGGAVKQGLQKLCMDLIDLGNNLNQLYLLSFEAANFTLVEYCLKKGAAVQTTDNAGYNVFLLAVKAGSLEGINYALNTLKISPASRSKINETALMISASGTSMPVFEKVLSLEGVSIEAVDDSGETALFYAAKNSKTEFILQLIQLGADVNHQNSDGLTPWMKALNANNWNGFLAFDATKIDDHLKDKSGKTILSYLNSKNLSNQRATILEYLSKGIDPNSINSSGENLAFYAIENSDLALLQAIKAAGGSLDGKNGRGERPTRMTSEIIHYIIENGADPNRKDNWGVSYLSEALEKNDLELAIFLIRNKANVNPVDRNEEPLIIKMVESGNLEAVKILAESNANLQVKNRWGKGILAIADTNVAMVAYLRSKGALTDKELAERLVQRNTEVAKFDGWIAIKNVAPVLATLKRYPEVHLSNEQLTKLAIISIGNSNLELLQYLVEQQQFDLTKTINFQQQTLLHLAAAEGNLEIVRLLVNKGVNVMQKDALDQLSLIHI